MLNLAGFCTSFCLVFLPLTSERGTWLCILHPGVVCSHSRYAAPAPFWCQHVLWGVDHPASNTKEGWNGVCGGSLT